MLIDQRPTNQVVTPAAPATVLHWPVLDGLRGVAVVAVVAYHFGRLSGGFLGVDLFFALSGFLITSLLVRESATTGTIGLRQFWGRRFRRLLPAVTMMIASVLALLSVWGTPAEQATARTDARWAIPYLANWHLVASARDYWASATSSSVFTHLWSLAIEEQFYVVWPIVAWLVLRNGPRERMLAAVTVVGAAASLVAVAMVHDPAVPSRVYFGTDTRAFAIFAGALMALEPVRGMLGRWHERHRRAASALVASIVACLALAWAVGGDHLAVLMAGGLAVHSVLAATLVALVVLRRNGSSGFLAHPILVWLGQRSYGIYLWHWPVIQILRPRLPDTPAALVDLLVIVITIVVSEVSYRWLEQPIRRRARWAAGGRATVATVAVVAVACVAVLIAPSGRGHVAEFDAASIGLSATIATFPDVALRLTDQQPKPQEPTPEQRTPEQRTPEQPQPQEPAPEEPQLREPVRLVATMLWVGDSVAADLEPAVTAALGAAGVAVTDGAVDGARLVTSGAADPVELYTEMMAENPVDLVVVQLSLWDSPFSVDELRWSVRWFHDLVLATGADLVFVTPPPVRADLIDPGLDRQIHVVRELLGETPDRVRLFDASAVWGPMMLVDLEGDGAPDRKPDGVHVCPQGAARFAAWLVDALDESFDGITPAFPSAWADGDWSGSRRYDTPAGACVALVSS